MPAEDVSAFLLAYPSLRKVLREATEFIELVSELASAQELGDVLSDPSSVLNSTRQLLATSLDDLVIRRLDPRCFQGLRDALEQCSSFQNAARSQLASQDIDPLEWLRDTLENGYDLADMYLYELQRYVFGWPGLALFDAYVGLLPNDTSLYNATRHWLHDARDHLAQLPGFGIV